MPDYFDGFEIPRPVPLKVMGVWTTKDSGEREVMETGSQRDSRQGKGRYDLITPFALRRLAGVYERGAVKYEERNWEKGQPQMRYFDSAIRHLMGWLEGLTDEDHLAQAMWNVSSMVHQDELIRRGVERYAGLDDRPTYWREEPKSDSNKNLPPSEFVQAKRGGNLQRDYEQALPLVGLGNERARTTQGQYPFGGPQ